MSTKSTETATSTTKPKKARKAKKATTPKVAKEKKAKAAKQPKTAKTPRAAKSNGHAAGPRGEKTKEIARLLQRKNGCTMKDVLDYTGWHAVSMPQQAKNCGLKLRKEKVKGEGPTRYFGA